MTKPKSRDIIIFMTIKNKILILSFIATQSFAGSSVYLTFDDLPSANMVDINDALRKHNVPSVLGFVNGKNAKYTANYDKLLKDWLSNGNLIGNHTWSHLDLAKVGPDDFITDIKQNEEMLDKYDKNHGYFRYPYLSEGKTKQDKEKVKNYLKNNSYRNIPVTVDVQDWRWNTAYTDCKNTGRNPDRMVDLYIDFTINTIEYSDALSIELFGYRIPQVVLLHVNELNKAALDGLLSRIEGSGFKYANLKEILNDKVLNRDTGFVSDYGSTLIYETISVRDYDSKKKLEFFKYYNKTIADINAYCDSPEQDHPPATVGPVKPERGI